MDAFTKDNVIKIAVPAATKIISYVVEKYGPVLVKKVVDGIDDLAKEWVIKFKESENPYDDFIVPILKFIDDQIED